MRTLCLPVTLCALLAVPSLTGQRMGRVNRDAPTAGCFIELHGGNRIEVSYQAITLAQGKFMQRLENLRKQEDKDQVNAYVERFNVTARQQPLGKLKVTGNITLGGAKIPAGDYGLAFMLDEKVQWQVVILDGEQTKASWTLDTKAPKATARRLSMALVAGDQAGADLGIAFGDVSSKLAVAAEPVERPTSQRVRGASGRRRR